MADDELSVSITADTSGLDFSDAISAVNEFSDQIDTTTSAAGTAFDDIASSSNAAMTEVASSFQAGGEAASEFGDALSEVGDVATGVFAGLTLESVLEKLVDYFKEATLGSMEWGESLVNASLGTGIAIDTLTRYEFAAATVGGSLDTVTRAAQKLESEGFKPMTDALARGLNYFGLTVSQITDVNSNMDTLAAAVQRMGNNAETTAALFDIFGFRIARNLAPFLEELPKAAEEQDKLNAKISPEGVKALDEMAKGWNSWIESVKVFTANYAVALTNALKSIWEWFGKIADAMVLPTVQMEPTIVAYNALAEAIKEAGNAPSPAGAKPPPVESAAAQKKAEEEATKAGLRDLEESRRIQEDVAKFETEYVKEKEAEVTASLEGIANDTKHAVLLQQINELKAKGRLEEAKIPDKSAELAAEQKFEDEKYAIEKIGLEARLEILKDDPNTSPAALEKIQSELIDLQLNYQKRTVEIANETVVANKKVAEESLKTWQSTLEPISRSFDLMLQGVVTGTETIGQAFKKMASSIGLSLAESGIKDLLLGTTKESSPFAKSLFGGGIAGELQKTFGDAFAGATAPVTSLFNRAFTAVGDTVASVFKSAFSGLAGFLGGGGGAAAAGDLASGASQTVSLLGKISDGILQNVEQVIETGAATVAQLVTLIGVELAKVVQPFGFQAGGVVPSLGTATALPALLHPREMVLPQSVAQHVQRGGILGQAAPTVHQHTWNINAVDSKSFMDHMASNQSEIMRQFARSASATRAGR